VTGAIRYKLMVDNDADFSSPKINTNKPGTTQYADNGAGAGGVVLARAGAGRRRDVTRSERGVELYH